MDTRSPYPDTVENERLVLRVLCQGTLRDKDRTDALKLLEGHTWCTRDHQVIFEALGKLGSIIPGAIREQLPACITRNGFPDSDFEFCFAPHELSPEQSLDLIRAISHEVRGGAAREDRHPPR